MPSLQIYQGGNIWIETPSDTVAKVVQHGIMKKGLIHSIREAPVRCSAKTPRIMQPSHGVAKGEWSSSRFALLPSCIWATAYETFSIRWVSTHRAQMKRPGTARVPTTEIGLSSRGLCAKPVLQRHQNKSLNPSKKLKSC